MIPVCSFSFDCFFIPPSDGVVSRTPSEGDPQVFISYQWDMQGKVEDIKQLLENNSLQCWADVSITLPPRGHSSKSSRSGVGLHDGGSETLQSQIQRNMKAASVVLSCITPKYLQSDNCKKDLTLAETFNKPVIPVLLRFSPQESAPEQVRKILSKFSYIDLSNERLYKQNIPLVLEKIKKAVSQRGGYRDYWGHHHDNRLSAFVYSQYLYRTIPVCASTLLQTGISMWGWVNHTLKRSCTINAKCANSWKRFMWYVYVDLDLSVWVTFKLFIRDVHVSVCWLLSCSSPEALTVFCSCLNKIISISCIGRFCLIY